MKIRCRKRRTSPSTRRQSTASQPRASSLGPFAPATAGTSNLPLGSRVVVTALSTGSPDPRGRPFGPGHQAPYPASAPAATARRSGRDACWVLSPFGVPAFAWWVFLRPLGLCAFLAVGLPSQARTPSGLPRCPRVRSDRDGCPLYSGGAVPTQPTQALRLPLAASQRPTPGPGCCFHHPRLGITERRQGFTRVHPSGLPRCR